MARTVACVKEVHQVADLKDHERILKSPSRSLPDCNRSIDRKPTPWRNELSWKLKRTTQCDKCPWRKDVDPNDIPNGYSAEKHCALKSTIAKPGDFTGLAGPLKVMACHETEDAHCIGWLNNQLGPGNNIAMRMAMRNCENASKIKIVGEQHETFEDTIPTL